MPASKPKEAEVETPQKDMGQSIDRYLTRGGGSVALAILVWMNTTLSSMNAEITGLNKTMVQVTTDLKYRDNLTVSQVRKMITLETEKITNAFPWNKDKDRWEAWRAEVTRDIERLKAKVDK